MSTCGEYALQKGSNPTSRTQNTLSNIMWLLVMRSCLETLCSFSSVQTMSGLQRNQALSYRIADLSEASGCSWLWFRSAKPRQRVPGELVPDHPSSDANIKKHLLVAVIQSSETFSIVIQQELTELPNCNAPALEDKKCSNFQKQLSKLFGDLRDIVDI
ncbi:hypothetical protein HUJ04_011486 [Dendroctonus ponderosae]|nr:hypothetical protein HUJ04_011486 [Dendroctonus ponderosae]